MLRRWQTYPLAVLEGGALYMFIASSLPVALVLLVLFIAGVLLVYCADMAAYRHR